MPYLPTTFIPSSYVPTGYFGGFGGGGYTGQPHIQLLLNVPRTEVRSEGWGVSRHARDFVFCELNSAGEYDPAVCPKKLWRMPGAGVLTLQPHVYDEDYEDVPEYRAHEQSAAATESIAQLQYMAAQRAWVLKPDSSSTVIESLITYGLMALLATDRGLKWAARSKSPLQDNEAFSVTVIPSGIGHNRSATHFAVMLGESALAILIHGNGYAEILYNKNGEWVNVGNYNFAKGGIYHTMPYQITVLPWGYSNITVVFGQGVNSKVKWYVGRGPGAPSVNNFNNWDDTDFAISIDLSEFGIECPYSSAIEQYVKIPAGRASIGLRASGQHYSYRSCRVRYHTAETGHIDMMRVGYVNSNEPEPTAYGFFNWDLASRTPRVRTWITNERNAAWTNGVDDWVVQHLTLQASTDLVYTPEVWAVECKSERVTHTPSWTQSDISDQWTMLRFQLSSLPKGGVLNAKLERPASDLPTVLRKGGPIQIKAIPYEGAEASPIWDGYIKRRSPTIGGPSMIIEDELEAADMWVRLNEAKLDRATMLEGRLVKDLFAEWFKHAGFGVTDYEFVGAELDALSIRTDGKPDNSQQLTNDCSVADAIRELQKRYSVQGFDRIHVRWSGSKWRVSMPCDWAQATEHPEPVRRFYLDSSLVPLLSGNVRNDWQRWNLDGLSGSNQHFIATSKLELTVDEILFNQLRVSASSRAGADYATIEAEPACLEDEDYFFFDGRIRPATVSEPEITAKNDAELACQGRMHYDFARKFCVQGAVEGEWQPGIEPDQWIAILGRDHNGAACSFGAWRIESVDVEIRRDWSSLEVPQTRWDWTGSYSLVYGGSTTIAGFPMAFTAVPW